MTKLEAVFERMKALPAHEQEQMADVVDEILDENTELRVSEEDYAEVERRLTLDEELIPHDEVFAAIYRKLGR